MNARLQEAIEKARQYAYGEIPITKTPPQVPKVGTKGICDYCGKECPVVVETQNKLFSVCWSDVCALKEIHGTTWEVKISSTLENNRSKRLQLNAQTISQQERQDATLLPNL